MRPEMRPPRLVAAHRSPSLTNRSNCSSFNSAVAGHSAAGSTRSSRSAQRLVVELPGQETEETAQPVQARPHRLTAAVSTLEFSLIRIQKLVSSNFRGDDILNFHLDDSKFLLGCGDVQYFFHPNRVFFKAHKCICTFSSFF